MGFNPRSSRSEFSGWVVPVEWDNKTCSCPGIHHAAKRPKHLQKISSPDAKGAAYWENEWKKLLAPALEARKRTDDFLRKPFRSVERFESQVKEYVDAERSALGSLTRYMCEDDAGRHP